MFVLADFANPLIIGGDFPLLATEAWYRIDGWGDMRGATLMASTLLPPALCFFIAERFWVGRRRYTVISGRGSALERASLPLGSSAGAWSPSASLVAAIILSLYFGVVAGAFTETWGVDWTPTLDNWPVVLAKADHLAQQPPLRRRGRDRRAATRSSEVTAMTRNTTNRTFAMPAAPAAMPPKPKTAAMRAMMKNTTA